MRKVLAKSESIVPSFIGTHTNFETDGSIISCLTLQHRVFIKIYFKTKHWMPKSFRKLNRTLTNMVNSHVLLTRVHESNNFGMVTIIQMIKTLWKSESKMDLKPRWDYSCLPSEEHKNLELPKMLQIDQVNLQPSNADTAALSQYLHIPKVNSSMSSLMETKILPFHRK